MQLQVIIFLLNYKNLCCCSATIKIPFVHNWKLYEMYTNFVLGILKM